MIFPVRCFTCGKVLGDKWDIFMDLQRDNYSVFDALDALSVTRLCCRRHFITHSEQTHILLKFNPADHASNTAENVAGA